MTIPTTIRTAVSQQAITKVTRLFNGTITDVLSELLQNARRAGASVIDIETVDLAGHHILSVRDDGHGIEDPSVLVTLGQSDWADEIKHREDPAGMGIFSLAGHRVEIRSYAHISRTGWRVVIPANAWETSAEISVESFPQASGTEILVDLPERWGNELEASAAQCALHFPLPVRLNGKELPREDFLSGARRVVRGKGYRIGIFQSEARGLGEGPRINFHGVTLSCRMPMISEIGSFAKWSAKVDILDAPELQLVLPARKEMVTNEAFDTLRLKVETEIFNTIATEAAHRLSFKTWRRAHQLGVPLPEATRWLHAWAPITADSRRRDIGPPVTDDRMIIVPYFEPDVEQCAAPAIRSNESLPGTAVCAEPEFEGYGWYDQLPRIVSLAFLVDVNGTTHRYGPDALLADDLNPGYVPSIQLELGIAASAAVGIELKRHALDMLVCSNDGYDLDDALIFISQGADTAPGALASLIEACLFSFNDDRDCDSWETQQASFARRARNVANILLHGEDRATIERIRDLLADEIAWHVPAGTVLTATIGKAGISLALIPEAA